jgi:GR25 family glycosyltransferase involved in LPS biosynthesis
MRISVLNLARSRDRLQSFLAHNAHLSDLHRQEAVEGRGYTRSFLQRVGAIDGEMPGYTDGAIGCALSHLGLWEETAASGKVLTIAEDDAVLHHRFEALAQQVLASLPSTWELVLWGWNFDSILAFDMLPGISPCVGLFHQQGVRENLLAFQQSEITPAAFRLQRAFGTVCLSVSPRGAERLLKHCLPIRPMDVFYPVLDARLPNTGIDSMMNELYPSMEAYVTLPPLAVTCNDHAISTVQDEVETTVLTEHSLAV